MMHYDSHIVLTCKLKIEIILENIAGYLGGVLEIITIHIFQSHYLKLNYYTGFLAV